MTLLLKTIAAAIESNNEDCQDLYIRHYNDCMVVSGYMNHHYRWHNIYQLNTIIRVHDVQNMASHYRNLQINNPNLVEEILNIVTGSIPE